MNNLGRKRFDVLLVEEHSGDTQLMKIAFKHCNVLAELHSAIHAEEALFFLNNPNKPDVDLILMGLDHEKKSHHDFLRQVKNHHRFSQLKVVAMTHPPSVSDLQELKGLGIDGYLEKPIDYKDFTQVARAVEAFLLNPK